MTSVQLSPLNTKKSNNQDDNKLISQKRSDNQSYSPIIGQYKLMNSETIIQNYNNNNNLVIDECCEKTEHIDIKETTKVKENVNLEVDVDKEIEDEIAKYQQQLLTASTIFNELCQNYTDDSESDSQNNDNSDDDDDNDEQLEDEENQLQQQDDFDEEDDSDEDDSEDSEDSDYIEESILNNCIKQQQFNHNSFINKKYSYIDTNSYFFSRQQQQQQQQQQKHINHIYADTSLRRELIEILTVMKNNEREKGNIVEDVCVHEIFL
ncbi:hypothetical protein RB653_001223 [Dictyostelium firmibasis]|uniref:Uncharacterized protein n=1 Tax=Dictyostelium firmibasis TaxID=79012 RepID=A0AAN7UGC4_9MYCE